MSITADRPIAVSPQLPRWMRAVGWRTLVAGVLLGGVVHICATFAAPLVGSNLAYQRLSEGLPPNKMTVMPAPSASRQILPFLPPDTMYAMCRYELTGGPVSVTAAVSGPGWVLSLHSRQGDNFYVLPGQQLSEDQVSFLLVPSGPADPTHAKPSPSQTETQVTSPTAEGLIVVRAPIIGTAWTAETEAALRRSSCTQVKR